MEKHRRAHILEVDFAKTQKVAHIQLNPFKSP